MRELLREGLPAMSLAEVKQNWDIFGEVDPLWSILTREGKQGGRWETGEFFETGIAMVGRLLPEVQSLQPALGRHRALDFGCGVGRLTQALAEHFDQVIGVDIAPSMIEKAKYLNKFGERCSYFVNDVSDMNMFPEDYFDFILTEYVLQHMNPSFAKNYLLEFLRILKPAGMLVFQLPSEYVRTTSTKELIRSLVPKPLLDVRSQLRRSLGLQKARMEMYIVPQREVVRLLENADARIERVWQDPEHDPRWVSLYYYVSKH
jgi:SAM-dependent methyltransferase